MDRALVALAQATKGFLAVAEGAALYEAARDTAQLGPVMEIGSYCGKSTVYLGAGAAEAGGVVFTVDHHRGSQEMQADWEHHDPAVVDPATGRMDSLPFLRATLTSARLESTVIAVVGESVTVAAHWHAPLGMVFIDGGHGAQPAHADYEAWSPKIVPGGLLAVHDVFPDPADGGRPPYEIFLRALDDGFVAHAAVDSLRLLRRPAEPTPTV